MFLDIKLTVHFFHKQTKQAFFFHQRGRLNTAAPQSPSDSGEQYKVLYDFTAQNVNEVSVKAGDVITVIDTAEDGWFTMLTNDSRKVIECVQAEIDPVRSGNIIFACVINNVIFLRVDLCQARIWRNTTIKKR